MMAPGAVTVRDDLDIIGSRNQHLPLSFAPFTKHWQHAAIILHLFMRGYDQRGFGEAALEVPVVISGSLLVLCTGPSQGDSDAVSWSDAGVSEIDLSLS